MSGCGASPTDGRLVPRSLRGSAAGPRTAAADPQRAAFRNGSRFPPSAPLPFRSSDRPKGTPRPGRDGSWKGPSMTRDLIVSSTPQETKVALLEDGVVSELFIEREAHRGIVGSIYKGRVTRVLPGMQSAFVDIGLERDALPARGRRLRGAAREPARRPRSGEEAARQTPPSRTSSARRAGRDGAGPEGAARDRRARASPPTSPCPAATSCSCPPSSTWGSRARSPTTRSGGGSRRILKELRAERGGGGLIARTAGRGRSREDFERDAAT